MYKKGVFYSLSLMLNAIIKNQQHLMTLLLFTQKSLNILLSNSHLLTRLGKYQKQILIQHIIKSLTNPSGNLSHQVLQNICGSTQISNQPGFNDQRLIYIKLSKRLGRKSKRTIVHTIQQTFEQSDNRGRRLNFYLPPGFASYVFLFVFDKVPLNKQALHSNIM